MIFEVRYEMNHCMQSQKKISISEISKYGKSKHSEYKN